MPRNATVELAYFPLPEAIAAVGPAKAVVGGWKELNYNIDQPGEPIVFRLFIPKLTIATLNATLTFAITDVTGAAQILGEATTEGITAAGNAAPVLIERRITPEKDFTIEPGKEGQRKINVEAELSASTFSVAANTAKNVAFLQIIGLGRQ